jgi:glycerophosphoryl diester phosphodiesterase
VTKSTGRTLSSLAILCLTVLIAGANGTQNLPRPRTPWNIAHRGASANAPENTLPAFQLAADQGATFVEFDLQLTKDRYIVCLHDTSLERTTDVEDVFPDRFRRAGASDTVKRWMLEDFTLAEIKRLDAGGWFDEKFRGTRIPTFAETIDALRGRSGLFIELKSPERYDGIEQMILTELESKGLAKPGANPKTPVLLQSFNASSLQILAGPLGTKLPIHFLIAARDAAPWMTAEGLEKIYAFATGISPEKSIVATHTDALARAKKMGLLITPYTFRSTAVSGFADVRAEMAHFLRLGVDGVITDNPDQVPK